jgi:hypothetical protein
MTESIQQCFERKINAWCERRNISTTLPLSQKETLRELYQNPHQVPSEEIFIAMLKAIPSHWTGEGLKQTIGEHKTNQDGKKYDMG